MLTEYLSRCRDDITEFLKLNLTGYVSPLSHNTHIHTLVEDDLLSFTSCGKMLRGALCSLGYDLFSEKPDKRVTALGAAVELVQSAFLIHDDIIDRDIVRRGNPSIHAVWQSRAEKRNVADAAHLGESLAICVGDLALFAAYHIISSFCGQKTEHLTALFSRELSAVALAQMLDTMYGAGWTEVSEEAVLSMYTQKTGRYTFSLPLSAGGLLAGGSESIRKHLEHAGELLGIAFQLKDDELGLFGDEEQLGKPIGSDIREGKKTLFYLRLAARGTESEDLIRYFGNPAIGETEIRQIRKRLEDCGIKEAVRDSMKSHTRKALEIIENMDGVREGALGLIRDLARYNLARGK